MEYSPSKKIMSSSYKAVFVAAIALTIGFFLIIALSGSNNQFPALIWGLTAWLTYRHKYKSLITFQKTLIGLTGVGILFSLANLDIKSYSFGVSWVDLLVGSIISFGVHNWLLRFFQKQFDNEVTSKPDGQPVNESIQACKANDSANIEDVNTTGQPVKDNGRESSSRDSLMSDEVASPRADEVEIKRAHHEYKPGNSSTPLSELLTSEKWLMLEKYHIKAMTIFNELEAYGEAYQAKFVGMAINRQRNQDLGEIGQSVVSEFDSRFTISEKSEINESLKKVYGLYGDEAADDFIEIYRVVGDELDVDKLEADINHKQKSSDFNKNE
jgi:hypothetical protein